MGRKTGPKPQFTLEQVVDTALEQGIDSFALNAVARQLGVAGPSLYRVVDSRDQLVELCLEKVGSQLPLPRPGQQWRDLLRQWFWDSYELMANYPGLVETLIRTPWAPVHIQHVLKSYVAALTAAGVPGGSKGAVYSLKLVGDNALFSEMAGRQTSDRVGGWNNIGAVTSEHFAGVDDPVFNTRNMRHHRELLTYKLETILAGIAGTDITTLPAGDVFAPDEGDTPHPDSS